MLIDLGKNLLKLWILKLLDISTLLNHSMTTEYSDDSTLIRLASEASL